MRIENESNFLAALSNGVNLFLGAGFSVLAEDKQGQALPSGSKLCEELIQEFGLPTNLQDLTHVATILKNTAQREFRSYLNARFTVGNFDPLYKAIEKIKIHSIITTNIDNLLFRIYSDSKRSYINDLDMHGANFGDRRAINLVTLHGCVLDDSREFFFSATELASVFGQDPDRWHFLTNALQSRPTLFWGYGLADAGALQALHPSSVGGMVRADTWITVLPETDEGTLQYFRALGFQILEADTRALLDLFKHREDVPEVEATSETPTYTLFPEWAIPDLGLVPVRPLLEFYRGAPPTWYDVFSGRLHLTRYHAQVRNSLSAGKDVLLVGVPGSGKTTLLMQVLKDFSFTGHKLVCDSITTGKATLIVNRLGGTRALIGIDNFADSTDGLLVLLKEPNIQILACERSYFFDIVSHKISGPNLQVLDVTDIDEIDIQKMLDQIPTEIRKADSDWPVSQDGMPPSIFEIVQSSVVFPALAIRYRKVLKEIAREDVRLLDFLLVCSYVHSCRTPISMDMLLAFFRGQITDFSEIYKLRSTLGRLVADYLGDLNDGVQDYYSPRSTLVAEAIVDQAGGDDLRRVITRFHNEVSILRIHYFDVFRRRAYDAYLMKRVFENWEEGMQFYRKAFKRDRTPYVLQQGALYLSHKCQFHEAFRMIDEALIMSNQRILTIRNSHAIILFTANIDRPETDGTVERTLQESMEILRECYRQDKRKVYHAITFADHALKYDNRFGRVKSKEYLDTALGWLNEEQERSPWNRNVKRLVSVVKRRLRA